MSEEISLSFTIDGWKMEMEAQALRYEEEGSSFWRLTPLEKRHDGDAEEMYGQ